MEIRKGSSVDGTRIPRDRLIRNRLKDSDIERTAYWSIIQNRLTRSRRLTFIILHIFQFIPSMDYRFLLKNYEEFTVVLKLIETSKYILLLIVSNVLNHHFDAPCTIHLTLEPVQIFDIVILHHPRCTSK